MVVDSLRVPQWISLVVSQLDEAEFVDVALLVDARPRPRARFAEQLRSLAYSLYERYEYRLLRAPRDACARVDLSSRCPHIDVHELPGEPVPTILRGLDVILHLGGQQLPAAAARYGVWSIHHGDPSEYRGGPPLFWEIYERNPVSGTALLAFADGGRARVVYRSYSATDLVSLYRNRNAAYWKAANFPLRCLRSLHERDLRSTAELPGSHELKPTRNPRHGMPSNAQMVSYALRVGARVAARKIRNRFTREQWFVAYRARRGETRSTDDLRDLKIVAPPPDRFYADPFVIGADGRHFLFFEDYSYAERRGRISYVELDPDYGDARPQPALARPYHLSYPFVFRWDGGVYMLPETAANRAVELYRADRLPDAWSLAAVLLDDVVAYDPTVLHHGGTFWLFGNTPVAGARIADELSLFFADSLFGPWTPHPLNPIVSDVRRARPAGGIFRRDGHLFRPAQDSSLGYGHAVVFNRVDVLTRSDYREVPVGRLGPEWLRGNLGTHTYSTDEAYEAVDGRRPSRRIAARLRPVAQRRRS